MELTQEQVDNITKVFNKLVEAFREFCEKLKEIFIKFINSIDFNKLKKIKRAQGILNRTKSRRIKKKQLSIISKLLE